VEKLLTMSANELSRLEVMQRLEERRLKQKEAAEILGVSVRQIKRLLSKYRKDGASGLVSHRRGKASNNQLSAEVKQKGLDLLKGKYRQYVRVNPTRDKEVAELGFLAKTCFSKFEYTLMQIQMKEKTKETERQKDPTLKMKSSVPLLWFQSKENQTLFLEGLQMIRASHLEVPAGSGEGERREGIQSGLTGGPNLTLFEEASQGMMLPDALALMGSLDLVIPDIDR